MDDGRTPACSPVPLGVESEGRDRDGVTEVSNVDMERKKDKEKQSCRDETVVVERGNREREWGQRRTVGNGCN